MRCWWSTARPIFGRARSFAVFLARKCGSPAWCGCSYRPWPMLRSTILAAWVALPLVILGAGGLAVDSSSPDALCPALEETRRAVAERLGSVELEGTWHARYVLVHRAQGDFVSLTLADPDDVLRLE